MPPYRTLSKIDIERIKQKYGSKLDHALPLISELIYNGYQNGKTEGYREAMRKLVQNVKK